MWREQECIDAMVWLAHQVELKRNAHGVLTAWAADGWEGEIPMDLDDPPEHLAHIVEIVLEIASDA